jgi:mannose-6-phosphate isomerase-like protein (cupin superfamily)
MTDDAQRPKTEASVHAPPAEVFAFQGFQLTILLSSGQTDGRFSMIEGLVPAGGDSGRHVQHREDETLLLTEGQLEVTLGSSIVNLTAGQSYFAPRGTPHRIRNVGSEPASDGRDHACRIRRVRALRRNADGSRRPSSAEGTDTR